MKETKKLNKVSWAPGSKLCQVKVIRKEDPPIKVGQKMPNTHPPPKVGLKMPNIPKRRKPSNFPTSCPSAYVPFKKESNMNHLKDKLPKIKWEIPPSFGLESNWLVASGEESEETKAQKLRESNVPEAVYPHISAIPPSPSMPLDVEEDRCLDDSQTPFIPIIPLEEADSSAPPPVKTLDNMLLSKSVLPQNPCKDSNSALVVGNTLLAAVAVATAIMKTMDPGSMIDTDLLVKYLKDPELTLQLINEHRLKSEMLEPCNTEPGRKAIEQVSTPSLTKPSVQPTKTTTGLPKPSDQLTKTATGLTKPSDQPAKTATGLTKPSVQLTKTATGLTKPSDQLAKTPTGLTKPPVQPTKAATGLTKPSVQPIKTVRGEKDQVGKSGQEPLTQFHVMKTGTAGGGSIIDLPSKNFVGAQSQMEMVKSEMFKIVNPIILPPIVAGSGSDSCFSFNPPQKPVSPPLIQIEKTSSEQCLDILTVPRPLIHSQGETFAPTVPSPSIHSHGETVLPSIPKPLIHSQGENVPPIIQRPLIHSQGERTYGTGLAPGERTYGTRLAPGPHIMHADNAATVQLQQCHIPRSLTHTVVGERTYETGHTPNRYTFSNYYASGRQEPVATSNQQFPQPRLAAGLYRNSELKDEHGGHNDHVVRINPTVGNPSQPDLSVYKRMIRDYGSPDNCTGSEPNSARPTQHSSVFGAPAFSANKTNVPELKYFSYYEFLTKQHGNTQNSSWDHHHNTQSSNMPIYKPNTQETSYFRHEVFDQKRPMATTHETVGPDAKRMKLGLGREIIGRT